MTDPYCPALRSALAAAAEELRMSLHLQATYVCVEGPRFETHAEIRMFQALGGDLVGMTGVPEVTLARELGQCYASVAIVTNAAAGLSAETLSHALAELNAAGALDWSRAVIDGSHLRAMKGGPKQDRARSTVPELARNTT